MRRVLARRHEARLVLGFNPIRRKRSFLLSFPSVSRTNVYPNKRATMILNSCSYKNSRYLPEIGIRKENMARNSWRRSCGFVIHPISSYSHCVSLCSPCGRLALFFIVRNFSIRWSFPFYEGHFRIHFRRELERHESNKDDV